MSGAFKNAMRVVLVACALSGCSREPLTTKVVAGKDMGNAFRNAGIVAEDRTVCFFNDPGKALSAEIGKPFTCRWERP